MEFDIVGEIKLAPGGLVIPVKQTYRYQQLKQDKPLVCRIDEKKEKRSLNANNYAWSLITSIAEIIGSSKDEVYIEMLKSYGKQGTASVRDFEAGKYERSQQYFERIGESVLDGKTFHHYRFFVGSSQYDTKEMSVLIDGIVSEAKELGIETATPDEIARMKQEWKK